MALDPSLLLIRLQRHTMDQARRALHTCLESQTAAEKTFCADLRAVSRETDLAVRSASDGDVEAFADWLRQGRESVERARIRVGTAVSQVASARAALNLACAGALAGETPHRARRRRAGAETTLRTRAAPEGTG